MNEVEYGAELAAVGSYIGKLNPKDFKRLDYATLCGNFTLTWRKHGVWDLAKWKPKFGHHWIQWTEMMFKMIKEGECVEILDPIPQALLRRQAYKLGLRIRIRYGKDGLIVYLVQRFETKVIDKVNKEDINEH